MIVAIDGPAGSGKSTVCKKVAQRLEYFYLDTGAMYRALTYAAVKENVNFSQENVLVSIAENAQIDIKGHGEEQRIYLDGQDITQEIRLPAITNKVKHIANIAAIRKILVVLQRSMSANRNVVLEGRDTTTVVFPHADIKVYLDANQQERARRRFIELQEKGLSVTLEEVLYDQKKRDESDFNRIVSPLKKAKGAIVIDTTNLSIEEVVREIVVIINKKRKVEWDLWYAFCAFLCAAFSKICFRLRVFGKENVPHYGGFILVANHTSHLDPVLAGCLCPRQLHYLARISLFEENPFLGGAIRSVHSHPVRRGEADRSALSLAENLLLSGKGVLFFPEGTRSEDGMIREGKGGVGFLACRTSIPVIPTYIRGAHKAMPKGARGIKCVPISVAYGKPLYFSINAQEKHNRKKIYQEATAEIMRAIKKLRDKQL